MAGSDDDDPWRRDRDMTDYEAAAIADRIVGFPRDLEEAAERAVELERAAAGATSGALVDLARDRDRGPWDRRLAERNPRRSRSTVEEDEMPRIQALVERTSHLRWLTIGAGATWSEQNTLDGDLIVTNLLVVTYEASPTPEKIVDVNVLYRDRAAGSGLARRVVFSAPIGALQRRWLQLTNFDDYFGARALWFMADDLLKQCADPTKAKLLAVKKYIQGVRDEFTKYHQAVGTAVSKPWVVGPQMSWEIANNSPAPITVEVAEFRARRIT